MILTCPDCATRYFVDDSKLGPQGRTVRCSACSASWTARPEEALELANTPEEGAVAVEPPQPTPEPAPEKLPLAYRAKVSERQSIRRAMVHGVVWAAILGGLAATLALSVVFRVEVVKLVPRAASAYAMAGMHVNAIGLTFEDIVARPALQDGHAALVVSGVVRNLEDHPVASPPLRIDVLDEHGKSVASTVQAIPDATIAPGEARHFVLSVIDPPPSAADVEVAFAVGAKAQAARAPKANQSAEAESAAPALRETSHEEHLQPLPAIPLPADHPEAVVSYQDHG